MADVLKPELLWIEGRCYRINDSTTQVVAFQEHDLYEYENSYNDEEHDDDDDEDIPVDKIDDYRYSTNLHVSKHYIGYVIGKKGATKMRIERDTRTEIKIPKQGQTGDIVIVGSNVSNVKTAKRRINIIVMSSRMKQKSTHFVSIPMNSPEIMRNFEKFKVTVLQNCPSRCLDESLFIRPEKLHVTIGVMCLMDNEERLQASKLLTEAKEKIIMPLVSSRGPIKIRLKGLSYMNDDPREIDVLYGLVQEEASSYGLIQSLADALVEIFNKAGFMPKEFDSDHVKLHVTLINSKYRKMRSGVDENVQNNSRKLRNRETFDGSQILGQFSDYDFGISELDYIHLSQRHSMGADGYYQPTCIISCKRDNSK